MYSSLKVCTAGIATTLLHIPMARDDEAHDNVRIPVLGRTPVSSVRVKAADRQTQTQSTDQQCSSRPPQFANLWFVLVSPVPWELHISMNAAELSPVIFSAVERWNWVTGGACF